MAKNQLYWFQDSFGKEAEGTETVRYIDVGLNMTITPRLSQDDKIL